MSTGIPLRDPQGNVIATTEPLPSPPQPPEQTEDERELMDWIEKQDLTVLFAWVMVKPINVNRTRGGILIPKHLRESMKQISVGEVVGVGAGEFDENGRRITNDCKLGDIVLYNGVDENLIEWNGQVVALLNRNYLVAKIPRARATPQPDVPRVYDESPCRPPSISCQAGKCRGNATLDQRASLEEGPVYSCICGWKTPAEPLFGPHAFVDIPGDPGTQRCGRCGSITNA